MKISIFPEAKAHPSSKEEKRVESFKVSSPNLPKAVEIVDDNALIKYVTSYAWSPFVFDGVRHADNFVSCDFLVYDIDEGLTIEKADEILSNTNYCYLILPSPSHTLEKHRFRVIIPLAHSILDFDTYDLTWQFGADLLGVVDEQCKDKARYYFGSRDDDGGCDFGKDFLTPIKKTLVPEKSGYTPSQTTMLSVTEDIQDLITQLYGEKRDKVPEAVDYFIKNAPTGLPGNWTNSLNAAAFSLALSGVDEEIIIQTFENLAPEGSLDKKDLYQVRRAVKDGQKVKD
jgi:hypothetical protein